MSVTIGLASRTSKERAHRLIERAPDDCVAIIRKATRTDEQNKKLWPMLEDIRRQVEGMDAFTRDDIKLRFLNALGTEMRFLPELDGAGLFPTGLKSSTLSKEQFSGLIELLYEYGARHGVVWSEPVEKAA
jgi:hypothetical protein